MRESQKEQWANGNISAQVADTMAIMSAGAIGYCRALQDVIELTYEDILESENE